MTSRQRYAYGSDPSQWAELFLPDGYGHPDFVGLAGVAVVIHGGYWRSTYGAELGEPLAADLATHGIPAWNLEYRRMGNGGGWPQTFADIAAGIDALSEPAAVHGLDLSRVVALGHSAGGQLAVWAAGRSAFPAGAVGANPAVPLSGVVSASGVLNLAQAKQLRLSGGAVKKLLGRNVSLADPMEALPLSVPVYAVHALNDQHVPASQSHSYVDAALASGGETHLVEVPGDHFDLIDVSSDAYGVCRGLVLRLMQRA